MVEQKFGVDEDICTGDHSCIRLSGCPSLSIADNPDPLREDPIAKVEPSCVGCGVCGEVAHVAVLCPSFYRVDLVRNPATIERFRYWIAGAIISWLQHRAESRRQRYVFNESGTSTTNGTKS